MSVQSFAPIRYPATGQQSIADSSSWTQAVDTHAERFSVQIEKATGMTLQVTAHENPATAADKWWRKVDLVDFTDADDEVLVNLLGPLTGVRIANASGGAVEAMIVALVLGVRVG